MRRALVVILIAIAAAAAGVGGTLLLSRETIPVANGLGLPVICDAGSRCWQGGQQVQQPGLRFVCGRPSDVGGWNDQSLSGFTTRDSATLWTCAAM